ncbi:MAG: MoxR family ATPase [Candidatus Obscuribacterales bacterium]|nr:MoxR family ATPase [Candidatus Obscuribacterales bacterium]
MVTVETLPKNLDAKLAELVASINRVLVGQSRSIHLAVTAFLAGGHVLLEDVPGVGKTLLAKTLARSVAANFTRVQCTPDLLPSDISGVSIYSQKEGTFNFVPGPIFTNILLADEINRATPRTQSSLLEAMEERQVTIDGETRELPELFFVIATQNPIEYHGTFPLPEAQIDRFMLCLSLGYPKPDEEVTMLEKTLQPDAFSATPVLTQEEVLQARRLVNKVFVDESIQRYIVDLVNATRHNSHIVLGVSPRGSQLMMRAAQATALLSGRNFVKPDDVKLLAPSVLGHRIIPRQKDNKVSHAEIIDQIIEQVAVPI